MTYLAQYLKTHSIDRNKHFQRVSNSWSAADEYGVEFVSPLLTESSSSILILNDESALITRALSAKKSVTVVDTSDSFKELEREGLSVQTIPQFYEMDGSFDCALIRIPKSLELFKAELLKCKSLLKPGSKLYAVGMVKHISDGCKELLEKSIGPTHAHKVFKKSILFEVTVAKIDGTHLPDSTHFYNEYQHSTLGTWCSLPGVFASKRVDAGTALLLESIEGLDKGTVLDYGCGDGVIAGSVLASSPNVEVHGIDISYSALSTTAKNIPSITIHEVGGDSLQSGYFDHIYSNPPFHTGTTFDISLALGIIKDAQRLLKEGGCFTLVFNKGLNYTPYLKKHFSTVTLKTQNKRYQVFECQK
ncbi:MAG: methyltransferase [Fibrobacterales bacterium]